MDATFYQGLAANLPSTKTPGAIYFLTDTKEIYFDKDANTRVLMGSSDVEWDNVLNKPFEDVEIVTAAQMQTMLNNNTWEEDVFYLIPEDEWEDTSSPLAVNKGGTGADNALTARTNLGVYSTTQVDTALSNKANKYTKTSITLSASNWTLNSTTEFYEYDLTGSYPSATYDVEVDLNWDSASADAADDWSSCQIVGSYSSNKLVARGGQPAENYPVILYVTSLT